MTRGLDTYVQTIQTGGYFAVCCWCGMLWTPDRTTEAEAQADCDEHERRCPKRPPRTLGDLHREALEA